MSFRYTIVLCVDIAVLLLQSEAFAADDPDLDQCMTADDAQPPDLDLAIAGCTRMLQRPKESPLNKAMAYNYRGIAFAKKNQLEEALADFTSAIRFDANKVEAYNNRGNVLQKRSDWDRAIAAYTQAILRDPKYVNAYTGRGRAKRQNGELAGGISDLTEAVSIDPNYERDWSNRGECWEMKGEFTLV